MSDTNSPHWSFWLIAVVALIWNGMGAMKVFMQFSAEGVAGFPEKYRAIIVDRPLWATVAFVFGAFTSVLGAIALLMRRAWAVPVFVISMIGLVVTLFHAASLQIVLGAFSGAELILTVAMPILLSGFLIWYARRARDTGWLH